MTNIYKTQENGKRVILWANANTGNVVIVGNTSASNVASVGQTVTDASISKVIYGSGPEASAYWTLSRGANIVGTYSGTGNMDYSATGVTLDMYADANVSATLVGSTNGFIIIEMKKNW